MLQVLPVAVNYFREIQGALTKDYAGTSTTYLWHATKLEVHASTESKY